eukprot:1656610-Amphidinium_carterae.2
MWSVAACFCHYPSYRQNVVALQLRHYSIDMVSDRFGVVRELSNGVGDGRLTYDKSNQYLILLFR